MKEHVMNLTPAPMQEIRTGNKTIELRLNDEKRKQISVGDTIKFINTEDSNDTLRVKVVDLFLFSSFAELYDNLPLLNCGYNEDNINTASPDDMEMYYSRESFNRFLIISLDVLICRYSPLLRAFPALFISEEPHKSFYYPSCFHSQK